jgi:hypothetical protein
MSRRNLGIYLGIVLAAICLISPGCSQSDPEIKIILAENIDAAGGQSNLDGIKNYSFTQGGQTVYLSAEGVMKVTSGKEPIITEVILATEQGVRRNCFNQITEYEGFEKSINQSLAKLESALFTLSNYKGQLTYLGLKQFGPKSLHMLTAMEGDLNIEFYIDSEDHFLKRLVFSGYSEDGGQYESNYDFVSFQEVEGIKIPESWFVSQVGTRGSLQNVENVQFNLELPPEFFESDAVNVGEVEIGEGSLNGRIVDFNVDRGNRLTISTNWTETCIEQAGFQNEDKLNLDIAGREIDLVFYVQSPPREAYSSGANFMMPNARIGNYVIYILSPELSDMLEELEPLMSIKTEKRTIQ